MIKSTALVNVNPRLGDIDLVNDGDMSVLTIVMNKDQLEWFRDFIREGRDIRGKEKELVFWIKDNRVRNLGWRKAE